MGWKLLKFLLCFLCPLICFTSFSAASELQVERYYPVREDISVFRWCTGIFFLENSEWVVSLKNSRLFRRQQGQRSFSGMRLGLNQPHSIAYNSVDSLYYVVDTDNNRVIYGPDLNDAAGISVVDTLAGIPLTRPHDVLVDPETDWVYVLNPAPVRLFRFKRTGEREEVLDLSATLIYARSLSLVNGIVYVVGSSTGKIVKVNDFSRNAFTVYQSHGKKEIEASGNWQTTGLVGNDLERYNGYWYLTSYFHPESCTLPVCDDNKNKFIRFSSWEDFEQGRWQDLSGLLPDGLVPYFLTLHAGALYIAVYNHSVPGQGDAIYKLVSAEAER